MRFLDGILVVGILSSVGLSVLLVLLGLDEGQGLIIGLIGTVLSLIIDLFARLREAETHILGSLTLSRELTNDKWLARIVGQISTDYQRVTISSEERFAQRARD